MPQLSPTTWNTIYYWESSGGSSWEPYLNVFARFQLIQRATPPDVGQRFGQRTTVAQHHLGSALGRQYSGQCSAGADFQDSLADEVVSTIPQEPGEDGGAGPVAQRIAGCRTLCVCSGYIRLESQVFHGSSILTSGTRTSSSSIGWYLPAAIVWWLLSRWRGCVEKTNFLMISSDISPSNRPDVILGFGFCGSASMFSISTIRLYLWWQRMSMLLEYF